MNEETMVILEMVRDGRLTAEQADRLLEALEAGAAEAPREAAGESAEEAFAQAPTMPDMGAFGRRLGRFAERWARFGQRMAAGFGPRRPARQATEAQPGAGLLLTEFDDVSWLRELDVHVKAGNLTVTRSPDDSFRILAFRWAGESAPPWAGNRSNDRYQVSLGEPGKTEGVEFRIELPVRADVTVRSDCGNVRVHDIEGNAKLQLEGGAVEVKKLEGNLEASTGGGPISVEDVEGSAELSTGGGPLSARQVEGDVQASTGGGPIEVSDVEGDIAVGTGGGPIQVSRIEGDARLSAGGGDISAADVEGNVVADTGTGNISIHAVSGDVRCYTQEGNIALSDISGNARAEAPRGKVSASKIGGELNATARDGVTRS
jgi:DUF4097 and DUF4098 domain-containing protein YvlB